MGECKNNTWFYKCSDEFIRTYKQKKRDHIKIITRIRPERQDDIDLFMSLFPNAKMKTNPRDVDAEGVIKNNWKFTPYNNLGFGDDYDLISFIIVNKENLQELSDIIIASFPNIYFKKATHSYTLKINKPEVKRGVWVSTNKEEIRTEFPIAIVSYGRHNQYGRTHKFLTECKIAHYLFVEPCEEESYKKWYNPDFCFLVVCEEDFHLQDMGSTPVRNAVLRHFRETDERVWILDDNIKEYKRLYQTQKNSVKSAEIFTSIEKYVSMYDNVGIASHNFSPDVREGGIRNVICKNGKAYSSMLLLTGGIRFAHKHQEDNLISIDYIESGYCNLCFNHFTYEKNTSGEDNGGNSKHIYKKDENNIGRKERFDYFADTVKRLFENGGITARLDKYGKPMKLENLMFHKPLKHEHYHHQFNYQNLMNHDINEIILKEEQPVIKYINDLILITDDKPIRKCKSKNVKIVPDPESDESDQCENVILQCNCEMGFVKRGNEFIACLNCDVGKDQRETEIEMEEAFREGRKDMLEELISKLPHLEKEILAIL